MFKNKRKNKRSSYIYLIAAAITQFASIVVLICAIAAKKKNPIAAMLSILALEGGTAVLLWAHVRKDLATLDVIGEEDDDDVLEINITDDDVAAETESAVD